jgi:hypothetical protein
VVVVDEEGGWGGRRRRRRRRRRSDVSMCHPPLLLSVFHFQKQSVLKDRIID